MGMIEDIMSAIRKGPELVSQANALKMNTKSVVRGAKDSTFQFPCLISDSAPIDMANTMARTLEQAYAVDTQQWISMNSMFDITIDPTPLSYLKKLHQNLKLESALDELTVDEKDIDHYMEKVYDGEYRLYMNKDHSYGVLFNEADHVTKELMESHQDLLRDYLSDFNFAPLEEVKVEAEGSVYDLTSAAIQGEVNNNRRKRMLDDLNSSSKGQGPKMVERDIKKSNDLMPFGLQVRLVAVNDKKEFVQFFDVVVGIKTILHLIPSEEMIDQISKTLMNRNPGFKFLKWTTGEISLFKDIIFNANEIKEDVVNKYSGKSPFFGRLKRLKDKKITFRNGTVPNGVIPNATIVITSYEADYLERAYSINVRNDSVAKKLVHELFLMSFIIMDEGSNTVSVMYDGSDSFHTYSMETLERDNAINSNKLGREIGRMISR